MKVILSYLRRRIDCAINGHWMEHVRNLYGDETNYRGGARSLWRCWNCGAQETRSYLAPVERERR